MPRFRHRLAALAIGVAAALMVAAPTLAHVVEHAGPYTLEIGWQHEPTYVGESNGVQVIVHDARDDPVTDLASDDLKVVVSTGGQQTGELTFEPGFDLEEMEGPLGEYDAAIVPTAPGDYTFHLTGSIHGQALDITVTSGAETFDTVKGTSDLEFPTKLPAVSEMVTRLDRIDARIAALPQGGPTQADLNEALAAANDAQAAAQRALIVGTAVGLAGLIVGTLGVGLALRRVRRTGPSE
jgi:hypothetical protein